MEGMVLYMYIEDLVGRIANSGQYIFENSISTHAFDRPIIDSLAQASAYTEKQRALALRLVTKYATQLTTALKIDVQSLLINPSFKNTIRILNNAKQITLGESADEKYIAVKFPYNEELVNVIKNFKKGIVSFNPKYITWDNNEKAWHFELNEQHLLFLSNLTGLSPEKSISCAACSFQPFKFSSISCAVSIFRPDSLSGSPTREVKSPTKKITS